MDPQINAGGVSVSPPSQFTVRVPNQPMPTNVQQPLQQQLLQQQQMMAPSNGVPSSVVMPSQSPQAPNKPRRGRPPKSVINQQFFDGCSVNSNNTFGPQSYSPAGGVRLAIPIAKVKTNPNALLRLSEAASAKAKRKYKKKKYDEDDEDELSDESDVTDDGDTGNVTGKENYSLRERRKPAHFRYGEYADGEDDDDDEDNYVTSSSKRKSTSASTNDADDQSSHATPKKKYSRNKSVKIVSSKPRKRGRPRVVPKQWDDDKIQALDDEMDDEMDAEYMEDVYLTQRRRREHIPMNTLTPAQKARLDAERETKRKERQLRMALREQAKELKNRIRRHHSYQPRVHHDRVHHPHVGENEDDSSYSSSYSSSSYTSSSRSSYTSSESGDEQPVADELEEDEYFDDVDEVPQNEMVERILMHRFVWRSANPVVAEAERNKEEEERKAAMIAAARSPSPVLIKVHPKQEPTPVSDGAQVSTAEEKLPVKEEKQDDGTDREKSPSPAIPSFVKLHLDGDSAVKKSRGRSTEKARDGDIRVVEYFVKFKETSFLHAGWVTEAKIVEKEAHVGAGKVKRYWKSLDVANGEQEALQRGLSNPFLLMTVDDILKTVGYAATSDSFEVLPDDVTPEEAADFFYSAFTHVDRIIASGPAPVSISTDPLAQNRHGQRMYLVKWLGFPYTDATWEFAEDFRDDGKIEEYKRFHVLPAKPPPPPLPERLWVNIDKSPDYKNGNELRPYQLEGLNWLIFNWSRGRSCILADEMGLGKTVQIVAFFEHLRSVQLLPGPFLVIVPLSTMSHWEHELREWTDMNVVSMIGPKANREQIKRWEWYYMDEEGNTLSRQIKFNVLLTTTEMVNNTMELDALSKIHWQVVIIDEAHRLKNVNCKLLQCLELVRGYYRILLTGTPIQNNTKELWSLLHYIEPDTFPDVDQFMELYGDVKDPKQVEDLKNILHDYLLKRVKADVEKSIPPKEETIVNVELTSMQKQYYRAFIEHNREFLTKGGTSASNSPHLLNLLMELRKVCCHPFLINGVEDRECPAEAWNNTQAYLQILVRASGKFVLLDKLLPHLYEDGHKVLIFSQLKGVLDLIGKYMKIKGYLFERLDGSVKANERVSAISRFGNPEFNRFAFLLSTRAGGVGVNLTSADTVIIFDSDWNPQNDVQAQARCHRIGQKKEVKVYRLISKDTYEESMFERASLKLGLEQAVLSNMNTASTKPSGETPIGLSREEISQMLKHGAYALYKDEEESAKASNTFCEEDINQILEKRSKRMVWRSDMQGSTFSKATFRLDGDAGTNIDVNAPDFWEKVMPAAATSKSLLDQLTAVVTSKDPTVKENWKRDKKLEFMTSLQSLVAEFVKSYNEAKGIQFFERDTLKSVLMLCISHPELLLPAELADMQKWLDDVDYNRRRRTTVTPSLDADFSTPAVMSGGRKKSTTNSSRDSKAAALKRLRGDDDDYEEGDMSEGEEQVATKRRRRGTSEHSVWNPSERRLLLDALFAVCRPDWQLIRQRARAFSKPLREVQEGCILFLECLSTYTKTPEEAAAFARLRSVLEAGRVLEPTEEDPRPIEELRPLVEVTEKQKEEFQTLAQQRMPGWEKRIEAMLLLKDEIEDAEKNQRPVMDGCATRFSKKPCAWWEPEKHNPDLLIGMYKHGWGMWDSIILDESLSFRESIKLHFPAEFAAVTNGETTVVENTDGQETQKQLPSGGIKFQNIISWPQSRGMTSLLMNLVKVADRHRKGLDKLPEQRPSSSAQNENDFDDVVLPPSVSPDASVPTQTDDGVANNVSETGKKDKKDKDKKEKKEKKDKKHHHHHHRHHSRSHSRSHHRGKSSSETSSDDGAAGDDKPSNQPQQPVQPQLQFLPLPQYLPQDQQQLLQMQIQHRLAQQRMLLQQLQQLKPPLVVQPLMQPPVHVQPSSVHQQQVEQVEQQQAPQMQTQNEVPQSQQQQQEADVKEQEQPSQQPSQQDGQPFVLKLKW